MTILSVLALALAAQSPQFPVQIASFTNGPFGAAAEVLPAAAGLSPRPGTYGEGVEVAEPTTLHSVRLNPVEGLIEVWVCPSWAGSDGKRHRIWATERAGGRQLVLEKSPLGMLRAELSTPTGLTVARTDVSRWQPGEWHHVGVGWLSNKGVPVGLALWVDKVAVDGPVTPHGVFDPSAMPQALVLGDRGDTLSIDELAIRPDIRAEGGYGMIACIYRDYFRTAPYDAVRIDPDPARVPSDRHLVAGFEKQFGLDACRQGAWEPVTENVVRYSQWAYFDAKPFITWTTSDPTIATVAANGRVKALRPGFCTLAAAFHNLTATYPLAVVPAERPDLGVICIQVTPRYRSDAVKDRIAPGETATARIRFGNFGLERVPAGAKVRFSLIPDRIRNYRLDSEERPVHVVDLTVPEALDPGVETAVETQFTFPAEPTWMVAELDPDDEIPEFCEANNRIAELTDARPIHMGYNPKYLTEDLKERKINHVGSLSYYDWIRAEKLRMDVMLREAVWPTTGPNGVEEAYRIDAVTALQGGKSEDEPFEKDNVYYDGGFPVNEPVDLMAIDCAIIHEFGHTILSQPDLYGYPVSGRNVFLTDEEGNPVAGTPAMPAVMGEDALAASPGINVPCYVGYPSLMDGCQLWLHPSQAGHVMFFRGYRPDRFWGTQGRLIPTRANWLLMTDAYDRPLRGAAVYVYHVAQAPVQDSGAKYFADRPKFVGQTDSEGRFVFPGETDADWDDPETDVVDGAVSVWNPFGTPASETAFTPNVWEVEGLLLLKIVSGSQTEYQFMDLTQFNVAFLSGERVCGKYPIRTSLLPTSEPTPIVRKPVPDAIRKENKRPVAVAPAEMTVHCGEEFTIDGSGSYDPEGQPLIFRWSVNGQWLAGNVSQASTLKLKAPSEPGEKEYRFWVLDGVRCSDAVTVKVKIVP